MDAICTATCRVDVAHLADAGQLCIPGVCIPFLPNLNMGKPILRQPCGIANAKVTLNLSDWLDALCCRTLMVGRWRLLLACDAVRAY